MSLLTYLRIGWRWYLAMLASLTSFTLDWLEEVHGCLLHAVAQLDKVIPEDDV